MMDKVDVPGQEEDRQAEKQGGAGLAMVEEECGPGEQNQRDDRRLLRQKLRAARADAENEAGRDRQEDVAFAPAEGVGR